MAQMLAQDTSIESSLGEFFLSLDWDLLCYHLSQVYRTDTTSGVKDVSSSWVGSTPNPETGQGDFHMHDDEGVGITMTY